MSATATKPAGSRLRKVECVYCGCIVRMSRAAMARSGVPSCGCGAGPMLVTELEDAARVLAADDLAAHPDYIELGMIEQRRAVREARGTGARMHCGGCHAFIPATNHDCGCGFANQISAGGRNTGRWVSGASYRPGGRPHGEMPF